MLLPTFIIKKPKKHGSFFSWMVQNINVLYSLKSHYIIRSCTYRALCKNIIVGAHNPKSMHMLYHLAKPELSPVLATMLARDECSYAIDAQMHREGVRDARRGSWSLQKKDPGRFYMMHLCALAFLDALSLYIGDAMCLLFVYLRYVRAQHKEPRLHCKCGAHLKIRPKPQRGRLCTQAVHVCVWSIRFYKWMCALEGKTPLRGCSLEYLARARCALLWMRHTYHA